MNLATWLFARESGAKSPTSFRALRWLTVLLPLLFLGALDLLRHALPLDALRGWQSSVVLFVLLAGAVALFSKAVLDVAETTHQRLMAQNQELAKLEAEAGDDLRRARAQRIVDYEDMKALTKEVMLDASVSKEKAHADLMRLWRQALSEKIMQAMSLFKGHLGERVGKQEG